MIKSLYILKIYAGIIFIIKFKHPTINPKQITKGRNVRNKVPVQQQLFILLARFLQKQTHLNSIGI
jgi:hypothetical protein